MNISTINYTPLKAALIKWGIKQVELANEVGVHESVISGLCRGWRNPDPELADRIAQRLGMSTSDLFPLVMERDR